MRTLTKSARYMVESLVKRSKVLLHQGSLDMRFGVILSEAWIKTMRWEGIERLLSSDRKVWRVNGELAGYLQRWGSLSNVVVLGGRTFGASDQLLRSQAMIEDWVLDRGYFGSDQEEYALKILCLGVDIK